MGLIHADLHGILDYATVAIFALAPFALGLGATASGICYALAGIHLAMTVLTGFGRGALDVVPPVWHGRVELAVGALLAAGPWLAGDLLGSTGKLFLSAMGALILVVALVSDYKPEAASGPTA